MTPEQSNELVNGGDTRLHHHREDRATQADLQAAERQVFVSADYTASYDDDYIFVMASSPVTITLPLGRDRIITVVRISGGSNVIVVPSGSETVNGATTLVIASSYAPRRLKGVKNIGYIEV